MTDTVIRAENLSKKYVIGHQRQEPYTALRDVIAEKVRGIGNVFGRNGKPDDPAHEEFWALKDVSFEIKQGDRIGIIGRNGAGKSTLLKILSRITEPTTGKVQIKGRVASLLEVGTGFHPELTGRENIYLNGAILGMSKQEIRRKFDEIVAFAEIEKFLDTPVKRYSSGMYVRLAFAVAAHLEPEILIVDEVLAVGDVQFQKKCLGKMEDVGKEGRTVLFVSHQISAIERLCKRVVVLKQGEVKFDGLTHKAISCYLSDLESATQGVDLSNMARTGSGLIQLKGFCIEDISGKNLTSAACGQDIALVFQYEAHSQIRGKQVSFGFSIHNTLGEVISILYSDYSGHYLDISETQGKVKCTIEDFPFSVGRYFVGVRILVNGEESDWPKGFVGILDVEGGDFYGDGQLGHSGVGSILLRGKWATATDLNF